jgi:hypothetical protein
MPGTANVAEVVRDAAERCDGHRRAIQARADALTAAVHPERPRWARSWLAGLEWISERQGSDAPQAWQPAASGVDTIEKRAAQ